MVWIDTLVVPLPHLNSASAGYACGKPYHWGPELRRNNICDDEQQRERHKDAAANHKGTCSYETPETPFRLFERRVQFLPFVKYLLPEGAPARTIELGECVFDPRCGEVCQDAHDDREHNRQGD